MKNQGRLAADADNHVRNLTERDRFMRRIAAQTGIMQLPGQHVCVSTARPQRLGVSVAHIAATVLSARNMSHGRI